MKVKNKSFRQTKGQTFTYKTMQQQAKNKEYKLYNILIYII